MEICHHFITSKPPLYNFQSFVYYIGSVYKYEHGNTNLVLASLQYVYPPPSKDTSVNMFKFSKDKISIQLMQNILAKSSNAPSSNLHS